MEGKYVLGKEGRHIRRGGEKERSVRRIGGKPDKLGKEEGEKEEKSVRGEGRAAK